MFAPESDCLSKKEADEMRLCYLSRWVVHNFEKTLGPHYAFEWAERLAGKDKFEALLACTSLDNRHRAMLAESIGVTCEDMDAAINVSVNL